MKIVSSHHKDQPISRGEFKLSDVDSFISEMYGLLSDLESRINIIPSNENEEFWNHKSSHDLLAQKNKAEKKVSEKANKINSYLLIVEKEMQRARRNIEALSSNIGRLHIDRTKDGFVKSKQQLESDYKRAETQRQKLLDLRKMTDQLLKRASEIKRPSSTTNENPPAQVQDVPVKKTRFDNEVDNLISLSSNGEK